MVPDVEEQRENNLGGVTGKGFMPGQSGNPGGRPKGSFSITRHLREALERQDEQGAKDLADAIINQAKEGNGVAIKAVLDRIDGPITEKLEHSGGITLDESERRRRVAALLERGRTRGAGSVTDDGPD